MKQKLNINFSKLEYECEKPTSHVRSKILWPIIKLGRMIEEYNDPSTPAIRDYYEDIKRATSYFYFDHMGRYIQISKCLTKVVSYSIEDRLPRTLSKRIEIEQHCFDQLAERKISVKSVETALKVGSFVVQYCKDRKDRVYQNVSFFHRDLRVVISVLDEAYRVKTAYRLTDINDKNLMEKIKKNQRLVSTKYSNPHDYAVVDLDQLYQSSLMINNKASSSKRELYDPAWKLLGNTFGTYSSCLTRNNERVRSNQAFETNQRIVENAILQSSLEGYRHKHFDQIDYDPKKEYGLIFFYEKESFLKIAKRIYGLGLSAKIVYKDSKVDPVTKNRLMMVGVSLTQSSGHEWIKNSSRKDLIVIDANACNKKNKPI